VKRCRLNLILGLANNSKLASLGHSWQVGLFALQATRLVSITNVASPPFQPPAVGWRRTVGCGMLACSLPFDLHSVLPLSAVQGSSSGLLMVSVK
jgi:hypothetical protein